MSLPRAGRRPSILTKRSPAGSSRPNDRQASQNVTAPSIIQTDLQPSKSLPRFTPRLRKTHRNGQLYVVWASSLWHLFSDRSGGPLAPALLVAAPSFLPTYHGTGGRPDVSLDTIPSTKPRLARWAVALAVAASMSQFQVVIQIEYPPLIDGLIPKLRPRDNVVARRIFGQHNLLAQPTDVAVALIDSGELTVHHRTWIPRLDQTVK